MHDFLIKNVIVIARFNKLIYKLYSEFHMTNEHETSIENISNDEAFITILD